MKASTPGGGFKVRLSLDQVGPVFKVNSVLIPSSTPVVVINKDNSNCLSFHFNKEVGKQSFFADIQLSVSRYY